MQSGCFAIATRSNLEGHRNLIFGFFLFGYVRDRVVQFPWGDFPGPCSVVCGYSRLQCVGRNKIRGILVQRHTEFPQEEYLQKASIYTWQVRYTTCIYVQLII